MRHRILKATFEWLICSVIAAAILTPWAFLVGACMATIPLTTLYVIWAGASIGLATIVVTWETAWDTYNYLG